MIEFRAATFYLYSMFMFTLGGVSGYFLSLYFN